MRPLDTEIWCGLLAPLWSAAVPSDYTQHLGWPTLSCNLLLRSALCGDRAAWAQWLDEFGLDRASWSEVRLLAAVAARSDLDVEPRVRGVQKFIWTQTHAQITPAFGALQALDRADIPLLLLKGAARIAVCPAVAAQRLIRDLDVLVPLPQAAAAFDVLCANGWELRGWQVALRQHDALAHHAWALSFGRSEIDVHHYSNFLNRSEDIDDGLWSRSLSVEWHKVRVRVPAQSDALALALIHGVRYSAERAADWVLDACAVLDAPRECDIWSPLLREVRQRRVEFVALAGLTYLSTLREIPSEVLGELRAAAEQHHRSLKIYTSLPCVLHSIIDL
jgi:hypothetical protein